MYPSFFGNYSSSFQVAANQSAIADLEKNDLQVGKGAADNTGSKVEFSSMVHSMGLAHVKFLETSVVAARLFNSSGAKLRDVGTATVYACETFTPNSYSASSHNFLRIGKPGSISFTPSSSSTFTWDKNSVALTANTASTLNVSCSKEYEYRGVPTNFDYTGSVQSYSAVAGTYLLECWGAQGGLSTGWGGYAAKGGYSYGCYKVMNNTTLYCCVGGQGKGQAEATNAYNANVGGYNGGGNGQCGGGGATHIATQNGVLSSLSSNRDAVVIVAGGAGGVDDRSPGKTCGHGGGIEGKSGTQGQGDSSLIGIITGGTQTEGGTCGNNWNLSNGSFGQGGNSVSTYTDSCAGGGGGWYGGAGQGYGGGGIAAGGSGYLSPSLSNSETIVGNTDIPYPTKSGTETGHSGNGYVCITQLSY